MAKPNKTGGGPGTNQYGIRGNAKTPKMPAPPLGMMQPGEAMDDLIRSVTPPDKPTVWIKCSGEAPDQYGQDLEYTLTQHPDGQWELYAMSQTSKWMFNQHWGKGDGGYGYDQVVEEIKAPDLLSLVNQIVAEDWNSGSSTFSTPVEHRALKQIARDGDISLAIVMAIASCSNPQVAGMVFDHPKLPDHLRAILVLGR